MMPIDTINTFLTTENMFTPAITGNMISERSGQCHCKNGLACGECKYCLGCSCRCHQNFTLHFRFFDEDTVTNIKNRVEMSARQHRDEDDHDKILDNMRFTARRLDAAGSSWGQKDEII